jgi:hypothetical protein
MTNASAIAVTGERRVRVRYEPPTCLQEIDPFPPEAQATGQALFVELTLISLKRLVADPPESIALLGPSSHQMPATESGM